MNLKDQIKEQLYKNSQPWILSGKVDKHSGGHKDDRYRLGDYKAFLTSNQDASEFSWVKEKFPGSLIDLYYREIENNNLLHGNGPHNHYPTKRTVLWNKIIKEKIKSAQPFEGITVSVRIGDIMPWITSGAIDKKTLLKVKKQKFPMKPEPRSPNNIYDKPAGFHKIYISPEEYANKAKKIIDIEGASSVRLLAGVYLDYGTKYTEGVDKDLEKQAAYLKSLVNIFEDLGCKTFIDAGHPDEDFIKMVSAKVLVMSRGSFSKISGIACKENGGRVYGTFRIDPDSVKHFCEEGAMPDKNANDAIWEDLENSYWTNL